MNDDDDSIFAADESSTAFDGFECHDESNEDIFNELKASLASSAPPLPPKPSPVSKPSPKSSSKPSKPPSKKRKREPATQAPTSAPSFAFTPTPTPTDHFFPPLEPIPELPAFSSPPKPQDRFVHSFLERRISNADIAATTFYLPRKTLTGVRRSLFDQETPAPRNAYYVLLCQPFNMSKELLDATNKAVRDIYFRNHVIRGPFTEPVPEQAQASPVKNAPKTREESSEYLHRQMKESMEAMNNVSYNMNVDMLPAAVREGAESLDIVEKRKDALRPHLLPTLRSAGLLAVAELMENKDLLPNRLLPVLVHPRGENLGTKDELTKWCASCSDWFAANLDDDTQLSTMAMMAFFSFSLKSITEDLASLISDDDTTMKRPLSIRPGITVQQYIPLNATQPCALCAHKEASVYLLLFEEAAEEFTVEKRLDPYTKLLKGHFGKSLAFFLEEKELVTSREIMSWFFFIVDALLKILSDGKETAKGALVKTLKCFPPSKSTTAESLLSEGSFPASYSALSKRCLTADPLKNRALEDALLALRTVINLSNMMRLGSIAFMQSSTKKN